MQNLDLAMPASEHPCFALEAPTGCFIRFGELCSKFDKEPCKNHDQAKRAKLSPKRKTEKPKHHVRHVTYKHNRTLNTSKRTSNRTLSPTLKRSAPSSLVKRKKQELQRLHSNWAIELFARNFQVPGRPIQDYCPPLPQLRGSEHCLGTSRTKIYVFFLTSTRPPSDCTFRVPFVSLQSCYA